MDMRVCKCTWISGAYIKIGYFETDADLRYQDEIHGSLFIQADRIIELIYLKYLKAEISYSNVTRIETYPFPKAAIREAVYNAIIHSNYAAQIPIQISVYEDRLYISNDCIFPVGWTVETLMEKHRSQPYNPNIANGFFRAGFVETWGRGIEKIWEACKKSGIPKPEYTLHPEDIMVKFIAGKKPEIPKHQNDALDDALGMKLMEVIRHNPKIQQQELTAQLNTSRATIQRLIKNLTQEGYLVRNNRALVPGTLNLLT